MKLRATERFIKDYGRLPAELRRQAKRKLRLLAADLSHPSLRVKRVRSRKGVYEGSITMDYRLLFRIEGNCLILERIGRHDVLDKR